MYKNIEGLAEKFLREQKIIELPITFDSLESIATKMGIEMRSYKQASMLIEKKGLVKYTKKYDAFAWTCENLKVVLYKDELSYSDKLVAIAHEIGHFYLKHTFYGILGKSHDKQIADFQEGEADAFAQYVLGSPMLLAKYNPETVDDVSKLTQLDRKHAEICFARYSDAKSKKSSKVWKTAFVAAALVSALLFLYILNLKTPDTAMQPQDNISDIQPHSVEQSTDASENKNTGDEETDIVPEPETKDDIIVYYTPSGQKFHLPTCKHVITKLDQSTKTTAREALKKGKAPCLDCLRDFYN